MKNKQRKGIKSNNLIVKNYQNITVAQPLFRFFLNKHSQMTLAGTSISYPRLPSFPFAACTTSPICASPL